MKKFIVCISIISCILCGSVFAVTHTLEEVAEKFNNCKSVESMKEYNYSYVASVDKENPNTLLISIKTEEDKSEFSFVLEDSILSNEKLSTDQLYASIMLIDAVGQVNGYNDGELFYTINSGKLQDYTLENEGIEVKENGDYYSIKMDIDKKIPLVDLTDYYLKPDEFDFIKDIVESNEVGNQTGKNLKMSFDIIVREEENYIYIGEEGEITKSTYNSILSALEVLYGNKVVEHFKTIYPEFKEEITNLDGFKIETNIDTDEYVFNNSKVVLVTVDNKYVKEELLKESSEDLTWTKASSWAEEELNKAKDNNIIPIIFDGADLTANITRLEFAHIAVLLYEKIAGEPVQVEGVIDNPFTDTVDDTVVVAYNLGITNGTSKTTFSPSDLITREQMATMLTRALTRAGIDTKVDLEKVSKFADDKDLHDWGRSSVYFMSSKGIIKGVGENKFNGLGKAKIEEAIAISLRSNEVFKNSNDGKDIPKNEQTGTAGSNIPLKDNLEEAEYQIKVAMQYYLEKAYGDKVIDARIYIEKIYTAEEEQEIEVLKEYNLGPNEVAFEVRYELKPAEGADINALTAATGEYDEESGWIKEKYNLGVLRPNESGEAKYIITDFGTGW